MRKMLCLMARIMEDSDFSYFSVWIHSFDKIRIENITFQNEFHNGDTNDGPAGGGAIAFNYSAY